MLELVNLPVSDVGSQKTDGEHWTEVWDAEETLNLSPVIKEAERLNLGFSLASCSLLGVGIKVCLE